MSASGTNKHSRTTNVGFITMSAEPATKPFPFKTACEHISARLDTDIAAFVMTASLASKLLSSIGELFMNIHVLNAPQSSTTWIACTLISKLPATAGALSQHLQSTIHVSQYRCLECERDFISESALEQHLKYKKNHCPTKKPITPSKNGSHICGKCDRDFSDETALEQHAKSIVHQALSQLRCIASSKCKGRFTSPSALLHHLESGACRSGLNRAALNQLVQTHDAGNVITFETQTGSLLGLSAEDWASTESFSSGLLTPSSHSSDTYSELMSAQLAPPASSNGYLELGPAQSAINEAGRCLCPLCPVGSRGFRTVQALSNHITSAAHAPKAFHCPVNLMSAIKKGKQQKPSIKEFSTLSGLTQHVESGACKGGKNMLKGAMDIVQERLKAMGFKEIELLK
ncbi:MAG: hypothetical protein Q9182_003305 [Xanthomendoza sp. 2 TL-2023]